jgi:hypothetical protein
MQFPLAEFELAGCRPSAGAVWRRGEGLGRCAINVRVRTRCARRDAAGSRSKSGTMPARATPKMTSKAKSLNRPSTASLAIRVLPSKESDTLGPATASREPEILKKALFPVDVSLGGAPLIAEPSGCSSESNTPSNTPPSSSQRTELGLPRSDHAFRRMLSPGGYACKILTSKIDFLELSRHSKPWLSATRMLER